MAVLPATFGYVSLTRMALSFLFESRGTNLLNALTTAFTVLGVLFAVWIAYKTQLPGPRLKWDWKHFPVTTPPSERAAQEGDRENLARWYHQISLENRGQLPATKPHITIKAPSPILSQRIAPRTGEDAFVPIPDPQAKDANILELQASRIAPKTKALIELWTVAEAPVSAEIRSDQQTKIQIWKFDDLQSQPSALPISIIVGLAAIILTTAFYLIAQKL